MWSCKCVHSRRFLRFSYPDLMLNKAKFPLEGKPRRFGLLPDNDEVIGSIPMSPTKMAVFRENNGFGSEEMPVNRPSLNVMRSVFVEKIVR